ncbi:hypothetical protein PENTCL1PPCAC_4201, partial [Pristionchus entomophagus]
HTFIHLWSRSRSAFSSIWYHQSHNRDEEADNEIESDVRDETGQRIDDFLIQLDMVAVLSEYFDEDSSRFLGRIRWTTQLD